MARIVIHPGEHLAEELDALGMSAAALARQLQVPTNRVTAILQGQRSITGDTALRLAHFFGTSAEFWLNRQSLYELRRAEQKAGKSIKALPRLKPREREQQGVGRLFPVPANSGPGALLCRAAKAFR
jgi:addiction module HigA family antidote